MIGADLRGHCIAVARVEQPQISMIAGDTSTHATCREGQGARGKEAHLELTVVGCPGQQACGVPGCAWQQAVRDTLQSLAISACVVCGPG